MEKINEKEYKYSKYFDTLEDAELFIKENNIIEYCFTTPEYLENGVNLNWNEKSKITVQVKSNYHCIRCMKKDPLLVAVWNKSGLSGSALCLCKECWNDLVKKVNDFKEDKDVRNN